QAALLVRRGRGERGAEALGRGPDSRGGAERVDAPGENRVRALSPRGRRGRREGGGSHDVLPSRRRERARPGLEPLPPLARKNAGGGLKQGLHVGGLLGGAPPGARVSAPPPAATAATVPPAAAPPAAPRSRRETIDRRIRTAIVVAIGLGIVIQ